MFSLGCRIPRCLAEPATFSIFSSQLTAFELIGNTERLRAAQMITATAESMFCWASGVAQSRVIFSVNIIVIVGYLDHFF